MSHPEAIAARLQLRKANDLLRGARHDIRRHRASLEAAIAAELSAYDMAQEAKATLERLGESGVGPLR